MLAVAADAGIDGGADAGSGEAGDGIVEVVGAGVGEIGEGVVFGGGEVITEGADGDDVEGAGGAEDLRQYGYSRDKRGDCRQVVIALIVTPEGFPLSYESWPATVPTTAP